MTTQQKSNDLTSQNRKTRINAIRESLSTANPASTNYTGPATKSNSHDLVNKLVADADNLFNNIISQIPANVNRISEQFKEKQLEADEYLHDELGIPEDLYQGMLNSYFTDHHLQSIKDVYNSMVEYLDKGTEGNRRGIESLSDSFDALFIEVPGIEDNLLKPEFFDKISEFASEQNNRSLDSYEFNYWFKKNNEELNKYAVDFAQEFLVGVISDLSDQISKAYVVDAINQCGGLKGIIKFANENSCKEWLTLRRDILYGANNSEGDYFVNKNKKVSPQTTEEAIKAMNDIDFDDI